MNKFTMRCVNCVNTDQAPDHIVIGFSPTDQTTIGTFQLVLPVEQFTNFRPGRIYDFDVTEQEPAAIPEM